MANRIEIQIALDVIKFSNIINDLLDCLSWQLQGIDPNTGGPFLLSDEMGKTHEPTVEEMKEIIQRTLANAEGYWNIISNGFKNIGSSTLLKNGLSALGVNANSLKSEVTDMKNVMDQIKADHTQMLNKEELRVLGQTVDSNIPKLKLLRRGWAIK